MDRIIEALKEFENTSRCFEKIFDEEGFKIKIYRDFSG